MAIIRPAVDAFDPRVLRASMGAFFQMNVAVFDSFEDYRALYPNHALYPFMLHAQAQILPQAAARHAPLYALVFGNEQTGLPEAYAGLGRRCSFPRPRRSIPEPGRGRIHRLLRFVPPRRRLPV